MHLERASRQGASQLALALGVPVEDGVLEPVEDEELEDEDPLDELPSLDAAGFASLLPDSAAAGFASDFSAEAAGLAFALEYRSAYQPPPLSRNPVPPEINRFALSLAHDTHFLSGRSLIDCSASH